MCTDQVLFCVCGPVTFQNTGQPLSQQALITSNLPPLLTTFPSVSLSYLQRWVLTEVTICRVSSPIVIYTELSWDFLDNFRILVCVQQLSRTLLYSIALPFTHSF
jgi:hypothetical protein